MCYENIDLFPSVLFTFFVPDPNGIFPGLDTDSSLMTPWIVSSPPNPVTLNLTETGLENK